MMITTDNNLGKCTVSENEISDIRFIANTPIKELIKNNPKLLVFPNNLGEYGDDIGNQNIFNLHEFNKSLHTGNLMGFVGRNDIEVTIASRFSDINQEDYFLHYMLQKVFSINIFDLKHSTRLDDGFDFLLYLFPYYLNKALLQGLYKEYKNIKYNDCRVKGTIDIPKNIRDNIPFSGKVNYKVREYSYDNHVTQLIRHTIEYIKCTNLGKNILNKDADTYKNVRTIESITITYVKNRRNSVIRENLKLINHPFFSNYILLQKICLMILRHENIKYGVEKNKLYGILFDGAWLWEEYLNTILNGLKFEHPRNKINQGKIYVFNNNLYKRYPDFYKDDIVLDAKYKKVNLKEIERDDLHQLITYMHILDSNSGGFVYPNKLVTKKETIGKLNGMAGNIFILGLKIPQNVSNMGQFINLINGEEEKIVDLLENICNTYCNQICI